MWNISENLKFFIMISVYLASMTWWASDINSNVEFNRLAITNATSTLQAHIIECDEKDRRILNLTWEVKELKREIHELRVKINENND